MRSIKILRAKNANKTSTKRYSLNSYIKAHMFLQLCILNLIEKIFTNWRKILFNRKIGKQFLHFLILFMLILNSPAVCVRHIYFVGHLALITLCN